MSIALVVTRGYSNGTLTGTIADVVLRGYSIGEALPDEAVTGGWLSAEQVAQLRRISKDTEDKSVTRSRRQKQRREKRLAELESIFNEIHGILPEPAVEAVAAAVRPFAESSDTLLPPVQAIDFTGLLLNVEAVQALVRSLLNANAIKEDEEIILLMMQA